MAGDAGGVEAGKVGRGDLGRGLTERVDGGEPTLTEHQGDVVVVDAGEAGEDLRGLAGQQLWFGHRRILRRRRYLIWAMRSRPRLP